MDLWTFPPENDDDDDKDGLLLSRMLSSSASSLPSPPRPALFRPGTNVQERTLDALFDLTDSVRVHKRLRVGIPGMVVNVKRRRNSAGETLAGNRKRLVRREFRRRGKQKRRLDEGGAMCV